MENYTQMVQFDWWLCLCVGLLLLICGIVGIVEDAKYKKSWWRWILHIVAIFMGLLFAYWTLA